MLERNIEGKCKLAASEPLQGFADSECMEAMAL
jgi:hypothetical protein